MHHLTLPDAARAAAIRTHVMAEEADAAVSAGIRRRLQHLRINGEDGAQAAEYAMLGGVSAAACTGLIALLKNKDTIGRVVDAVLTVLSQVIGGWF